MKKDSDLVNKKDKIRFSALSLDTYKMLLDVYFLSLLNKVAIGPLRTYRGTCSIVDRMKLGQARRFSFDVSISAQKFILASWVTQREGVTSSFCLKKPIDKVCTAN